MEYSSKMPTVWAHLVKVRPFLFAFTLARLS